MKIGDAHGNTLTLPRPAMICNQCLTDPAAWYSHDPVIAVYCEHVGGTSAIWHPGIAKWIVLQPVSRADHIKGLAAAQAAQTLREMVDGKPRH